MSGYSAPRPIKPDDETADFHSGEPSLDEWLGKRALANQAAGASRCFVTCRDGRIFGYYALATGSVHRIGASRRAGQGMPDPIPVILLGRLAVDLTEQGRGLGGQLLRDGIMRSVQAAEVVGVRALLVHALHERAREFYLHHGFELSLTYPLHLLLLMKDARAVVGAH
jgi:GNAT superfamily N-acetyltransferase